MADFVAIVGPTASGKSALALRLAETMPAEIVSADAFQVYRGFDIGTAKPSPEERERVPHHLIDILDPAEPYSAGEFGRRAAAALAAIHQRGRLPIVVGGSGLYVRALCDGLSPLPAVPAEVRRRWRERLRVEGLAPLRRELETRDPAAAERLEPGDPQRTLRALEVLDATGVAWSQWIVAPAVPATSLAPLRIGLTLSKGVLYDRIRARLREMVKRGWVEEVQRLLARGLSPSLEAFVAIGYRALADHVLGSLSLESALLRGERDTRRYAKRQMTWFRHEPKVRWLTAPDASEVSRLLEA